MTTIGEAARCKRGLTLLLLRLICDWSTQAFYKGRRFWGKKEGAFKEKKERERYLRRKRKETIKEPDDPTGKIETSTWSGISIFQQN